MKKTSLFLPAVVLASIMSTGCSLNNAATLPSAETTVLAPDISTDPEQLEESSSIAESANGSNAGQSSTVEESALESDQPYVLSTKATSELSMIFEHCYYSGLGHDKTLQFSTLSQDEASALLFWALLNPGTPLYQGTDLSSNGLSKYSIPYATAKEFFQEAFGANLDSYDFTDYIEDDAIIWHGGDYGSDVPSAIIDIITQSPENGLITITGDAFDIYDADMSITYAKFTATMVPSDSSYFDGNTLVSFIYEDNTSDDHPEINLSEYFAYY